PAARPGQGPAPGPPRRRPPPAARPRGPAVRTGRPQAAPVGGRDVPIEADDPDRRPKLTITRSIPRGHDPGHPEAPPAPVRAVVPGPAWRGASPRDRKSTRLNSSHVKSSYAV